MADETVLVLPAVDDDTIASGLYELSKILGTLDAQARDLPGGDWGYGQDFSNDVFEMFPFWWGECGAGAADEQAHDDRCPVVRPNFKHYESGLEVRWYKYIGRSMEVSDEVDAVTWGRIWTDCLASLSGGDDG